MRPYGSKRSFDTEPRIKSARALVKREGEVLIEEQTAVAEARCASCQGYATWYYAPADSPPLRWCDWCVPRGCCCQEDPSLPCVEYMEHE